MSSLFDSFFGFIFWGVAYIRMRSADHGPDFYKTRGIRGWLGFLFNVGLILIGLFFLGPGTYVSLPVNISLSPSHSGCMLIPLSLQASVMAVVQSYQAGTVGGVFTCASNGL